MIRFFTFEQFHNRNGVGSTKIRVHSLLKYWKEAELYKYGENPDVIIFQKVYCTFDYKFPANFKGKKILDVCDPDWLDTPDYYIKETIDAMDAVVVPSENLQKLLQSMTKTPVLIIKDRFDLTDFPPPKKHSGDIRTVVWFGYSHNAELLKSAIPAIEKRGLRLIVVSNKDPFPTKWGLNENKYTFYKWDKNAYKNIQQADVCVLPQGYRPKDRFKSENKTVIAQLLGLPIASTADELDQLMNAEQRNKAVDTVYDIVRKEYDCQLSVKEYKDLIDEIKSNS